MLLPTVFVYAVIHYMQRIRIYIFDFWPRRVHFSFRFVRPNVAFFLGRTPTSEKEREWEKKKSGKNAHYIQILLLLFSFDRHGKNTDILKIYTFVRIRSVNISKSSQTFFYMFSYFLSFGLVSLAGLRISFRSHFLPFFPIKTIAHIQVMGCKMQRVWMPW